MAGSVSTGSALSAMVNVPPRTGCGPAGVDAAPPVFVLGRMANAGAELPEAVAEAQAAGFAEADPTQDLGGYDAAYKIAILASIGFGARVHPDFVYREGIEGVRAVDFRYARELGYELKKIEPPVQIGNRIGLGHRLAQHYRAAVRVQPS